MDPLNCLRRTLSISCGIMLCFLHLVIETTNLYHSCKTNVNMRTHEFFIGVIKLFILFFEVVIVNIELNLQI